MRIRKPDPLDDRYKDDNEEELAYEDPVYDREDQGGWN